MISAASTHSGREVGGRCIGVVRAWAAVANVQAERPKAAPRVLSILSTPGAPSVTILLKLAFRGDMVVDRSQNARNASACRIDQRSVAAAVGSYEIRRRVLR